VHSSSCQLYVTHFPELLVLLLPLLLLLLRFELPGAAVGCVHDVCAAALQACSDEPVWRQVLQHHLRQSDPAVAEQAATALAH
jgi:hypothetical protein